MSDTISRLSNVSILITSLAMFGCSSGGDAGVSTPLYSGAVTPAAITLANAEEVAQKSTEGVNEAVNMTNAGDGIPFLPTAVEAGSSTDATAQKISNIVFSVLNGTTSLNLPAAAVLTADDLNAENTDPSVVFCGGSVSVPDNVDPNATTFDLSMGFNRLCVDDGVTVMEMNGSLRFVMTETSVSITFTNFSVSADGVQETFSGVFSCDGTMSNCALSTDYVGSDGNVYRLADVDISGDSQIGYSVGAAFYHHELGSVTIATVTPVAYGGCGVYPSGGTITVSSTDGSSITITFSGCSYSINGVDANSGPILVNGSWI